MERARGSLRLHCTPSLDRQMYVPDGFASARLIHQSPDMCTIGGGDSRSPAQVTAKCRWGCVRKESVLSQSKQIFAIRFATCLIRLKNMERCAEHFEKIARYEAKEKFAETDI